VSDDRPSSPVPEPEEPTDEPPAADPADHVARTRRTYDRVAREYDETVPDAGELASLMEPFESGLPRECRLLDLGCGPGRDAAWFAARGHDVVGADLSDGQLRVARERAPSLRFVQADMRSLPFAAATFDGCWSLASLLHVPRADVPGTLAEIRRVLRPGAPLFASVKHGDGSETTYRYGTETGRHFVHWRPDAFRERFEAAGFDVREVQVDESDWLRVLARA
jgi:SAM-dependent methyltransferase